MAGLPYGRGLNPNISQQNQNYEFRRLLQELGIISQPTRVYTVDVDAEFGRTTRVDTSGGGVTVTMPNAVGNDGKRVVIKKISSDTNAITIAFRGSQTADGQTSLSFNASYGTFVAEAAGGNFDIIYEF